MTLENIIANIYMFNKNFKFQLKYIHFFVILFVIFVPLISFSQTPNTWQEDLSSKVLAISKQLGELEKFVYNSNSVDSKAQSSLPAGQQKRVDALETAVKELRGIIEVDIQEFKKAIIALNNKVEIISNKNNNSENQISPDFTKITDNLISLKDKMRLIESRINTTVDLIGKSEVRIMRVESLLNSGVISNEKKSIPSSQSFLNETIPETSELKTIGSVIVDDNETLGLLSITDEKFEQSKLENERIKLKYLPEGDSDVQFKYALELALKRQYNEAELALSEFMEVNKDDKRLQDAHFWYGGVLFRQQKFEESAFIDIDFNEKYPNDSRLVDTTLRIAQAMSFVAQPEQACAVFENSLNFIVNPPERFVRKINELKADKACD